VFGEYLRILYYSKRGDIEGLNSPIKGLEEYIETFF